MTTLTARTEVQEPCYHDYEYENGPKDIVPKTRFDMLCTLLVSGIYIHHF